jgi:hypothetical protein
VIRAVEVRCTGKKGNGQCRKLVAVLFWPEDPSEGQPKLRIYPDRKMRYTLNRDLYRNDPIPLFCYDCTANKDYQLVELGPLLACPLAEALASEKTVTAPLHPTRYPVC